MSVGPTLLRAFEAAVANLEAHVEEINALNVFPVPDGDTGSNLLATVRGALDEAARTDAASVDAVAGAMSFGALMGARGNSGVITSQLLRGIADAVAGKERLTGLDLAYAFAEGTRAAYSAVAQPVEGTMLTVARDASEAAVEAAERGGDVGAVLEAAVAGAADSVRRTPSLLPILRESGVVDAGGQGLFRLLEGAALARGPHADAADLPTAPRIAPASSLPAVVAGHAIGGDGGRRFGYEAMFIVEARPASSLDIPAIRRELEALGESVLVAGDAQRVKIHVHGDRPDAVISLGLSLGSIRNVVIENLDAQAAGVRDEREGRPSDARDGHTTRRDLAAERGRAAAATSGPAVVAVVAGPGLARVFRALGIDALLEGGAADNPSAGELLEAIRRTAAGEVLVLPNHPNVRPAADQAAAMSADRRVVVVPTRNAAEGIAALLRLDRAKSAAENVDPMAEAARSVATLQVTEAVRDATVAGRRVRKGETIVLDPDEGIVAAGADGVAVVVRALAALPDDAELITIYYGAGRDAASAAALAREVAAARPTAEVEVVEGGQPHYRYLISAE